MQSDFFSFFQVVRERIIATCNTILTLQETASRISWYLDYCFVLSHFLLLEHAKLQGVKQANSTQKNFSDNSMFVLSQRQVLQKLSDSSSRKISQ